jgi:hypothetical protein
MAKKIITADQILQLTGVSGDIDENILNPNIKKAQDLQLNRIFGDALYNKIVTDYPAFTGVYSTIYNDYALPILANWSIAYHVKKNFAEINDIGNSKKKTDNSDPLSASDNDVLWKNYVEDATAYELKFIDFTTKNTIAELAIDLPVTSLKTFY